MSTRTLVSDDGTYRVYEVRDDDGEVIGSDVEAVMPDPPQVDVDALTAALAALPDDALTALRDTITTALGDRGGPA